MKILFLDIDGVLVSDSSFVLYGKMPRSPGVNWDCFNPVAVALLQKIVRDTGAVCVLSSSWRVLCDLVALGKRLGVTFVGKTGRQAATRGKEIEQWLTVNPEVESYVILDDRSDFHDDQKPFLVRTQFSDGLNMDGCYKAISLLGLK